MKQFAFLLILLAFAFGCQSTKSGRGGLFSKKIKLLTIEDSMYYAFGAFLVKSMPVEGVAWEVDQFDSGLTEEMEGKAKIDLDSATHIIQPFGKEIQARQGRKITEEDGIDVNMEEVSYAYGMYFARQLADIEMEIQAKPFIAGFGDANAGKDLLLSEEKVEHFSNLFNQKASEQARTIQAGKAEAEAAANKEAGKLFMEENKKAEGVIEHESGMQYKVLKSGDAAAKSPSISDKVTIHYEGRLLDGTVFDSSYKRGEKATFPLNNLIKGWQIALPMMKPGEKWTIWLPSDLAYGNLGSPPSIPAGATLVFDIEYFGIGE